MRRRAVIALCATLGCVLALGLGSCLALGQMKGQMAAVEALAVGQVDLRGVKDGTYEYYEDHGVDTARVRVTVVAGTLAGIELLEHRHGPGESHSGAAVVQRVLKAQGLGVEVVSGATGSSKVILKAIENALRKGL